MANPQIVQTLVIGAYLDLVGKLNELPAEIAKAQAELMTVKIQLGKTEAELKDIESSTALTVEGPNADARKAKLAEVLRKNPTYGRFSTVAENERKDVAQLTKQVADLERQYGAVCYQSQLHTGLMNYLGNAGANIHVPEMTFAMGALALHVNGNGYVNGSAQDAVTATSDDAAELGL